MKKITSIFCLVGLTLFIVGCCPRCPNLIVSDLEVNWDSNNKTAQAEISNIGNQDAGQFLVYFNADENPVSQNHRPQVSHHVEGLAQGASITLDADFAPLAHVDNSNLGNVYQITVLVDPKEMVNECDEDDNTNDEPVGCETIDSDLTDGAPDNIPKNGQSFNETRAISLSVLSSTDRITESITLHELRLPGTKSALVGVRIYDDVTRDLVASVNNTVVGGSMDNSVTIPIIATLSAGKSYRIGFYVETTPSSLASGNFIFNYPESYPYNENSGIFRVNSAHSIAQDAFPDITNSFVPKIIIRSSCVR